MKEEKQKDALYALLHEFNDEMNYPMLQTPEERRAVKNKFVDEIYSLLCKK